MISVSGTSCIRAGENKYRGLNDRYRGVMHRTKLEAKTNYGFKSDGDDDVDDDGDGDGDGDSDGDGDADGDDDVVMLKMIPMTMKMIALKS